MILGNICFDKLLQTEIFFIQLLGIVGE